VSDARITTPFFTRDVGPDPLSDRGLDQRRFAPVWNGMLQEFRNHLSGLMAAATELRSELPPAVALHAGAAVGEAEHNVQSLRSLLALIDASLHTVDPTISDLHDVVDRAISIAGPGLGQRISVSTQVGRKTGIKNCGSTLECLLAALLVDLARASGRPSGSVPRAENDTAPRATRLRLWADAGRGSLEIELDSDGPRPAPGSWRFLLACDLALKLGATITSPPDVAAYVVHFR
jgi:hypothetical protein